MIEKSSHLTILSYADEHNIDPRATGTHGGRGLERYLLGSVAEKVARLAETQALTVRLADSDDLLNAPQSTNSYYAAREISTHEGKLHAK